jgi:hypothetical protein
MQHFCARLELAPEMRNAPWADPWFLDSEKWYSHARLFLDQEGRVGWKDTRGKGTACARVWHTSGTNGAFISFQLFPKDSCDWCIQLHMAVFNMLEGSGKLRVEFRITCIGSTTDTLGMIAEVFKEVRRIRSSSGAGLKVVTADFCGESFGGDSVNATTFADAMHPRTGGFGKVRRGHLLKGVIH